MTRYFVRTCLPWKQCILNHAIIQHSNKCLYSLTISVWILTSLLILKLFVINYYAKELFVNHPARQAKGETFTNDHTVQQAKNETVFFSKAHATPPLPIKPPLPVTLFSAYLLNNPDICHAADNLTYVIIAHTSTNNFRKREIIRNTWANKTLFPTVRIVFLLGTTLNNQTQNKIGSEFRQYGDIVQGNFHDSYSNLTHKGVMGLRWVMEFCSEAKAVLKVDDDIVLNMFLFLRDFLEQLASGHFAMMGHIRHDSPIQRNRKSKWYVEESNYWFRNNKTFPIYANGLLVGLSMDLLEVMYQHTFKTPFFWIDDVYLFGLLQKDTNVTYIDINKNIRYNIVDVIECYSKSATCKLAIGYGNDKNNKLWDMMLKQELGARPNV